MDRIACDLDRHERRVYSQNGEDGVLARLFQLVPPVARHFVEFGVEDGRQRNTRLLETQGWGGLLMDCDAPPDHPRIRRAAVTAESVNDLFRQHGVPPEFDLLSIDIDGNDYWVWNALDPSYRPRVVAVEYNASFPPTESVAIAYDPDFRWRRTNYFGASLLAFARLGARRGYELVYCDRRGVNAFFVRADVNPYLPRTVADVYRQPDYLGGRWWGLGRLLWRRGRGHALDTRNMVPVEQ